jgi:hypothetical protein
MAASANEPLNHPKRGARRRPELAWTGDLDRTGPLIQPASTTPVRWSSTIWTKSFVGLRQLDQPAGPATSAGNFDRPRPWTSFRPPIACIRYPVDRHRAAQQSTRSSSVEASPPSTCVTGPTSRTTGDSPESAALDQGLPIVQRAWSTRVDQRGLVHAHRGRRMWRTPGPPGLLVQQAWTSTGGPAAWSTSLSRAIGPWSGWARLVAGARRTAARATLRPRSSPNFRAVVLVLGNPGVVRSPGSSSPCRGTACAGVSSITTLTGPPDAARNLALDALTFAPPRRGAKEDAAS